MASLKEENIAEKQVETLRDGSWECVVPKPDRQATLENDVILPPWTASFSPSDGNPDCMRQRLYLDIKRTTVYAVGQFRSLSLLVWFGLIILGYDFTTSSW